MPQIVPSNQNQSNILMYVHTATFISKDQGMYSGHLIVVFTTLQDTKDTVQRNINL